MLVIALGELWVELKLLMVIKNIKITMKKEKRKFKVEL